MLWLGGALCLLAAACASSVTGYVRIEGSGYPLFWTGAAASAAVTIVLLAQAVRLAAPPQPVGGALVVLAAAAASAVALRDIKTVPDQLGAVLLAALAVLTVSALIAAQTRG